MWINIYLWDYFVPYLYYIVLCVCTIMNVFVKDMEPKPHDCSCGAGPMIRLMARTKANYGQFFYSCPIGGNHACHFIWANAWSRSRAARTRGTTSHSAHSSRSFGILSWCPYICSRHGDVASSNVIRTDHTVSPDHPYQSVVFGFCRCFCLLIYGEIIVVLGCCPKYV